MMMTNSLEGFEDFFKKNCLDAYGYNPDLNWIFEKHENGEYIQWEVEAAAKVWRNRQSKIEELESYRKPCKCGSKEIHIDREGYVLRHCYRCGGYKTYVQNHNTSCTYQFELAFHRLQDTPELRKIYWSALGQLQFDSNDQVIPPELEECPCCKQPIIRKIGIETAGYETYDIGIDESGNRYIRHPHCEWEPEE